MESRFRRDFAGVRVHTDTKAAESARAIHAAAYTVGHHVVFAAGRYRPTSSVGKTLLAHELAHVVQQRSRGESTQVQRACLTPAECQTASGQGAQTRATVSAPAQQQRRRTRQQHCSSQPANPACTNDGHGTRAQNLEQLLFSYRPQRRGLIHGIFVDRDIPSDWKAYRSSCANFTPPINNPGHCIFAPQTSEREAQEYHAGNATIGGSPRADWRLLNLRVLMHETGHARFENVTHRVAPPGTCNFTQIRSELHEIAADMEEFEAAHDLLTDMNLTPSQQRTRLDGMLTGRWVGRARENWKAIRCVCECVDANAHLENTVANMTIHWPEHLQRRFHSAMQASIPSWPIALPQPQPGDYPLPRGTTRRA
jgi:hypothetical protein